MRPAEFTVVDRYPHAKPATLGRYGGTAWFVCCPACGKSTLMGEPYSRHIFTVDSEGRVSTNGSIICQRVHRLPKNGRRPVKCEAHFTIAANRIHWHGDPPEASS